MAQFAGSFDPHRAALEVDIRLLVTLVTFSLLAQTYLLLLANYYPYVTRDSISYAPESRTEVLLAVL